MGNLLDYIDWRGDLTLRQSAFCDIDALVLSCLSYVDLKDIVPGIGEGEITLRDAAELFFEKFSKEETEKDKRFTAYAPKMMGPLAESKRFGGAVLRNFTDRLDEDKHLQFAALEIEMDDGGLFPRFPRNRRHNGWVERGLRSQLYACSRGRLRGGICKPSVLGS